MKLDMLYNLVRRSSHLLYVLSSLIWKKIYCISKMGYFGHWWNHGFEIWFGTLTYAPSSRWSIGHQWPLALVISDRLVPCCFSSASVSHLQLLRGRPLFLFPWGFQVRAWHAVLNAGFLKVCPIQPHFFRSICLATGSCPAGSHRSSFRNFSCH